MVAAKLANIQPSHHAGPIGPAAITQPEAAKRLNVGNGAKSRRLIRDTEAILHPGEIQRPFKTDESEPDWLAEELAPPKLACES